MDIIRIVTGYGRYHSPVDRSREFGVVEGEISITILKKVEQYSLGISLLCVSTDPNIRFDTLEISKVIQQLVRKRVGLG